MQYDEITVGGEPYPTRNSAGLPLTHTTTGELYNLADGDLRQAIAIHEAGHAVAHLAGARAHLIEASLLPVQPDVIPGFVHAYSYDLHGDALVIAYCAGERAVDQWLRRRGLWTHARAVAAEVAARHDRVGSLAIPGMTHTRLRAMHDPTDDLLTAHWARVEAVAEALVRAGTLTGDQIATTADLPNPPMPESVTCRS